MSFVTATLLIEDNLGTMVVALEKYRDWEPQHYYDFSFSDRSKTDPCALFVSFL